MTWRRTNGEIIISDDTHNIGTPINNGSHVISILLMEPLRLRDSGEYECTVEFDIYGSAESAQSSASSELYIKSRHK